MVCVELNFRKYYHLVSVGGWCLGVKQVQGQRQAILSGYWLVVSSLNYWFLTQTHSRLFTILVAVVVSG